MERVSAEGPASRAASSSDATGPVFSQRIQAQFIYLSQKAHPVVVAAIVDRFIAEKLLLPEHRNHRFIQSVLELSRRRFGSFPDLARLESPDAVLQALSEHLRQSQAFLISETSPENFNVTQQNPVAGQHAQGDNVSCATSLPSKPSNHLNDSSHPESASSTAINLETGPQSLLHAIQGDNRHDPQSAVTYSLWPSGLFGSTEASECQQGQGAAAPTSNAPHVLVVASTDAWTSGPMPLQLPLVHSTAMNMSTNTLNVKKNSDVPDSVRSLWTDGFSGTSALVIPTSLPSNGIHEVPASVAPSVELQPGRLSQAEILVQPQNHVQMSASHRGTNSSTDLAQLLQGHMLAVSQASTVPASTNSKAGSLDMHLLPQSSGLLQLSAGPTLLNTSQPQALLNGGFVPATTRDLKAFTLSSRFRWCQVCELQPSLMYTPDDLDQFVVQVGRFGFTPGQHSPGLDLLNSLFIEWCDQAAVSQEFQAAVQAATQELNVILHDINLSVQLVGSSACGVALKEHSQVDWALMPLEGDTSTTYAKVLAFQAAKDLLTAKGILRADTTFASSIPTAVSGIKFVHPKLNIMCNLFIAGAEPAARTQLMAFITGANPTVVAVMRLIKMWSKRMSLNNPAAGTMSSWCWFLLFMYHLQNHRRSPLVPFKQVFGEGIGGDASIAGRMKEGKLTTRDLEILQQSVVHLQHRLATELQDSVAELLLSFFCRCSSLACSWRSSGGGISIWHAAAIQEDKVPAHMPIFVEDPLDVHSNAASGTKADIAHHFGNEAYVAAQALLKVKNDTQAVQCLADLFDLRNVSSNGTAGSRPWSNLSMI